MSENPRELVAQAQALLADLQTLLLNGGEYTHTLADLAMVLERLAEAVTLIQSELVTIRRACRHWRRMESLLVTLAQKEQEALMGQAIKIKKS